MVSSESVRSGFKELLEQRKEALERAGFRGMIVQPRKDPRKDRRPSIIWSASSRCQILGSKEVRREFQKVDGQILKFWREKIFLPKLEARNEEGISSLNDLIGNLRKQRQETLKSNGGLSGQEEWENYLTRIELDREIAINEAHREQLLAAQDRAREGMLGICLLCGRQISEERLDALPCASECIECAETREARERKERRRCF